MKLADAIAKHLPLELEIQGLSHPLPVAWLWELREGGIAYCFPGWGSSPSAESHMHRGSVEGEGPWRLLDLDRENEDGSPLRVTIRRARAHPSGRETEGDALRYFLNWHDNELTPDGVLSGTRKPK